MNPSLLDRVSTFPNSVIPFPEPHPNGDGPEMSSTAQDRLWISQTLAGDSQVYAHLINKYKDQLFDLTCRVLKDRCEGEDILQDSFLQAYQNLNRFRYDSSFLTWIYTIVMNNMRNRLRRNKIIRWSSLDAPLLGEKATYRPEMQHKELPIDVAMESKLDLEAIQQIVATFPLTFQSIFIMHYFQNLSLQEISDRLAKPLGTVKAYLHRSRKLLYGVYQKRATSPIADLKISTLTFTDH